VQRPDGQKVLLQDGDSIYLAGRGATDSGDRPFLDRMDLKSLHTERLFRGDESSLESFAAFVPAGSRRSVLTSRESRTEPPNWYLLDLQSKKRTRLTDYKDPAPQLSGIDKRLVKYHRADGVPLSGFLYLPPAYEPGTRLPVVMWAYPLEYSDAGTAGQVRGSANTFVRLTGDSPLFFLTQGYAVLQDATMPVIGDPERMNDTYIEQIVAAAQAAIDTLVAMGVADRERVCIAGHSYGAFMTANLLAHSNLFAAGIARSGAYNRSLTPFGFQAERRSYWEATDVYTRISPFTSADKIDEPLLLIHGEEDNNSGTFPIQSERLFQAIQGNGGTARLVLLPHEAHGYRARESILTVLAEMFEWCDRYVKNPTPRGASASRAGEGGGGAR
jgi:dipeptidyl aminopeptidase/acylaminoacyl peptidase